MLASLYIDLLISAITWCPRNTIDCLSSRVTFTDAVVEAAVAAATAAIAAAVEANPKAP